MTATRSRARLRIDADDVVVVGARGDAIVVEVVCPLCAEPHRHLWVPGSRGGPGWKTPPCGRDRASNRYLIPEPADPEPAHLAQQIAEAWTGRPKRCRPALKVVMKKWRR